MADATHAPAKPAAPSRRVVPLSAEDRERLARRLVARWKASPYGRLRRRFQAMLLAQLRLDDQLEAGELKRLLGLAGLGDKRNGAWSWEDADDPGELAFLNRLLALCGGVTMTRPEMHPRTEWHERLAEVWWLDEEERRDREDWERAQTRREAAEVLRVLRAAVERGDLAESETARWILARLEEMARSGWWRDPPAVHPDETG
jgi:hypothetical protein